ncbi:MAG: tail fiber domain-containing protein [Bacteroidetes bacterium]|nr:tail fiber domain-containing protein [Bacteroidota bacterium]
MKRILMPGLCLLMASVFSVSVFSQNIAITDDDGYSAHTSAMLDVKSVSKGMLVPRLSTDQRTAIISPAEGLLVFDTDLGIFFFHNGTDWISLTSSTNSLWSKTGTNVHLVTATDRVGVGTGSPLGKLEVKGDVDISSSDPLFEVINSVGDTVFAVYSQGVRIYVADDPLVKAAGTRSGFAVGGFSLSKGTITNEYLRVTPDSVRVYIEKETKGTNRGGFAVGGFSLSKTTPDNLLFVDNDSTRVWTSTTGGFEISDHTSGSDNYLNLTPDNYFIGHESGQKVLSGTHNSFIGYMAGFSNTHGDNNIFLGYQAGFSNTGSFSYTNAENNIFIGNRSGYNNTGGDYDNEGSSNIFIGYESGFSNTEGYKNIFIGNHSGYSNLGSQYGYNNVFIGDEAGTNNTEGVNNVFIGTRAGYSNTGLGSAQGGNNIFIGTEAGKDNVSGNYNVYAGFMSGENNVSGSNNVFLGDYTGRMSASGGANTYIGSAAGYNASGGHNTFIGSYAGCADPTSYDLNYNTLLGDGSGGSIITGQYNVILGSSAGYYIDEGNNNVFIGHEAGMGFGGGPNNPGSGNIFIGYRAGFYETGDNKLYIDNSDGSSPLIWGDLAANTIVVNGNSFHNYNSRTFFVNGPAGGTDAWFNDSDERLKKNITTLPDALERVQKLRGVRFEWKNPESGKSAQMGFIAQEAEKIIPEVVCNEGGKYSMQYAPVTALLVEAVKEQQKMIDELKKDNSELKKDNFYLKSEIDNIKVLIQSTAKK